MGALVADPTTPSACRPTAAACAAVAGDPPRHCRLSGQAGGLQTERADTGAVTLIQRFGSAANLNIHLLEKEADDRTVRQAALRKTKRHAERVVAEGCKKNGVSLTELRNGSRRGKLPVVRAQIVKDWWKVLVLRWQRWRARWVSRLLESRRS